MSIKEIQDAQGIRRSLTRIAHEIIEHNKGIDNLVFIGVKTRGVFLAARLADIIEQVEGVLLDCYPLDVHHWRDDHMKDTTLPNNVSLPVHNKKVILVDDVLFKGRTVRAAMDAIMHYGRAKEIQLAVLVDRGHRELPIRADYIGKNIPSSLEETIKVKVKEIDDIDGIYLSKKE